MVFAIRQKGRNRMRAIDGDKLIKALMRKEPFNDCARVVIAELHDMISLLDLERHEKGN